jgi:hypothetical protein
MKNENLFQIPIYILIIYFLLITSIFFVKVISYIQEYPYEYSFSFVTFVYVGFFVSAFGLLFNCRWALNTSSLFLFLQIVRIVTTLFFTQYNFSQGQIVWATFEMLYCLLMIIYCNIGFVRTKFSDDFYSSIIFGTLIILYSVFREKSGIIFIDTFWALMMIGGFYLLSYGYKKLHSEQL